jgi:hypothetical protein
MGAARIGFVGLVAAAAVGFGAVCPRAAEARRVEVVADEGYFLSHDTRRPVTLRARCLDALERLDRAFRDGKYRLYEMVWMIPSASVREDAAEIVNEITSAPRIAISRARGCCERIGPKRRTPEKGTFACLRAALRAVPAAPAGAR